MSELSMSEKEVEQFDDWVSQCEYEMFKVENFKQIGKEDDFVFQTLAFMGEASCNMSLAYTLSENINNFSNELKNAFRSLSEQYRELQDEVRKLY